MNKISSLSRINKHDWTAESVIIASNIRLHNPRGVHNGIFHLCTPLICTGKWGRIKINDGGLLSLIPRFKYKGSLVSNIIILLLQFVFRQVDYF